MRSLHDQPQPVVAWLMLLSLSTAAMSQPQSAVINREYAIKAAFLYHFSTYVTWPPDALPKAGQPFVIGMYGSDPFGTSLAQIAKSKTVEGRAIEIRRLDLPSQVSQCQILFIPKSVPDKERSAVLRAARETPVLVVGETDDILKQGGGIQFFVEGNKVRFAIGAGTAKRADLKVSSKLLSLAKIVPNR